MFESLQISPSMLSADFMHMEESVRAIEEGGASFVHIDVMDGHFVPNLTMGVPFVAQLKKVTKLPLDVHLMISNPLDQLPWFLDAGADYVTVHIEALDGAAGEPARAIRMIRDAGAHPALTCKPDTPASELFPYLPELDMVLVMSVHPGFSGQSYIEGSERKVAALAARGKEAKADFLIEVDGGIDVNTAPKVVAAGADVLVAGNAVFGAEDPGQAIAELRRAGNAARRAALAGMKGAR